MVDWDRIFKKQDRRTPVYDGWLDKFLPFLEISRGIPVIDLGCGFGNDTLYLREKGFSVISCDMSVEALKRLKYFIDNPLTSCFDMRSGLPFRDNSALVVISDLSLHYFSKDDTFRIIGEISRVLMPGGYLICRVNSVNDLNYGAGRGEIIEEYFYNVDDNTKRFFDYSQIERFFAGWKTRYITECEMKRYKMVKMVWEFAMEKTADNNT